MENKYYVYRHIRKDTNEVFYVGKGFGNRAYRKYRNSYWTNITNVTDYIVDICVTGLTEEEAHDLEMLLIREYKSIRQAYCNFTDGGEGTTGYKHTEYNKKYVLGKHSIGRTPWNKGKKQPEITGASHGRSRPVICTDTGVEYVSATEAGRELGISTSSVTAVCKGRRNTVKKLKFKYKDIK